MDENEIWSCFVQQYNQQQRWTDVLRNEGQDGKRKYNQHINALKENKTGFVKVQQN